jgi:cyclic pyranopterin phosphate synthase
MVRSRLLRSLFTGALSRAVDGAYLTIMSPYDATKELHVANPATPGLVDGFGRVVSYLRLSVTDRCDLRCVYCMSERMVFLPKAEVLTLSELDAIATAFIGMGVRKLRLTGGEPLVWRGLLELVASLSRHLKSGALEELTMTTNGARLAQFAGDLAQLGVRRINVSLDTLKPDVFAHLTRGGELLKVLEGIAAARSAGLEVKINTVALAGDNEEEIPDLIKWAHGSGMDLTLIETMPLGDTGEDRSSQFLALDGVRDRLASFWTLTDLPERTAGPARYVRIRETGGRLGLITPLSHNFCEGCNRVRLTCTGVLHTCLGREDAADLRAVMRSGAGIGGLRAAIRAAISDKPQGHDFNVGRGAAPALARHMSTTGG